MKYVEEALHDVYLKTEPTIRNLWDRAYKNGLQALDFVYKDGPVKLYSWLDKNALQPLNKHYQRNWEKSLKRMSASVGQVIDSALSQVSLEFLRPYMK